MLPLLSWIITGLVVGLIARALLPGKQSMGAAATIVVGVIGAFVGGILSMAIWPSWTDDPNVSRMWPGWMMSILGGIVVLWLYTALAGNRTTTRGGFLSR